MQPFTLRVLTDTAHPQDIVPIYLMHSFENPFCPIPSCWCHTDQEKIAALLEHIKNGVMTLQEAALFADGRTV
jgi:hypothetical protein